MSRVGHRRPDLRVDVRAAAIRDRRRVAGDRGVHRARADVQPTGHDRVQAALRLGDPRDRRPDAADVGDAVRARGPDRVAAAMVGRFTAADVSPVAQALQWWAIGLVFFAAMMFLLRTFYSLKDTRTPDAPEPRRHRAASRPLHRADHRDRWVERPGDQRHTHRRDDHLGSKDRCARPDPPSARSTATTPAACCGCTC